MCKRWMMVFRIVWLSVHSLARLGSCSANLRCACWIVIHSVRCHVNATDYWCNEIAKTTHTHAHTSKSNRKWAMVWMILICPAKKTTENLMTIFYGLCIFLLLFYLWYESFAHFHSSFNSIHWPFNFHYPFDLMNSCVFALLCFQFN